MELNIIYNESCLDTMKRIPDDSIHLVFTSPPYNMNLRIRNGKYCSRQIVKEFSTKYNHFSDNLPIDEFYELHSQIISELLRVSELVFYNISIVTGSKRAFFKIIGTFAEYLKEIIVWDKGFAEPAMHTGVLNRQSELLLVFDREDAISRCFKNATFDRGTLSDIWTIKRERSTLAANKASFPEALAHKVITNFSSVGNLIYDPFMGTGTTAKVALDTSRTFLGSELDRDYWEHANKRIGVSV